MIIKRTVNSKPRYLTRHGLRFPVYVLIGVLLAALGNASPLPKSTSNRVPPQPTLVAVVSGEGEPEMNMDAVVIVRGGKLTAPYVEDSEAAQQKFAKEYFQTGQKYRLTFGGGEVGTATVKKSDTGCNNIHATVTVETTAKIHGQVKALATNSTSLGRRASARRAPTDAERTAVMDLVKKIYSQHRVTSAQYRSLKVTNLAATDLDGDGKYEVIGSFALALKTKAQRDLFLLAESQGAGMRAGFAKFQAYQPPPEGFLSSIDFVDQLDLDGDGTGEVFAVQGGFDGYGYVIFKKLGGRWREVYSAMGDAC
ncbi:MAG: hypothetical protein M3R68_00235 [Acidobacteriota bacterium]|nr:hypothetical protein [Acidobacteriota bacterium]